MDTDIYPFIVKKQDDLKSKYTIYSNSRYEISIEEINQNLIDSVFGKGKIKKNGNTIEAENSFINFSAKFSDVYKRLISGNFILKVDRKIPISVEDGNKIHRSTEAVINIIHLFSKITLNEYLTLDNSGVHLGGGSRGRDTKLAAFGNLDEEKIRLIKEYFEKLLKCDDKKIQMYFEILKKSDININNGIGLQCSLLVMLIEIILLKDIRSSSDNFNHAVSYYFDSSCSYEGFYKNRSIFFHSGVNNFIRDDWDNLHSIVEKLISDILDDKVSFEERIRIIRDKYR